MSSVTLKKKMRLLSYTTTLYSSTEFYMTGRKELAWLSMPRNWGILRRQFFINLTLLSGMLHASYPSECHPLILEKKSNPSSLDYRIPDKELFKCHENWILSMVRVSIMDLQRDDLFEARVHSVSCWVIIQLCNQTPQLFFYKWTWQLQGFIGHGQRLVSVPLHSASAGTTSPP